MSNSTFGGTPALKPIQHGIFHKLFYGNLKYKIATTCLLVGGTYIFLNFLKEEDEEEQEFESDRKKYEGDEDENEITYLEYDERSFIRKLVSKFWIPSFKFVSPSWFDSYQTTKEIEESNKVAAWHYSELDSAAGAMGTLKEQDAKSMPDELLFLSRATKILGHFEKNSMMVTWKNIESVEVPKGEYLFRIGDPDINVYVLLTGLITLVVVDKEVQARQKFKKPYMKFTTVKPGQQIYSTLSFLDVITGHGGCFKSLEAFAIEDSVVLKIPVSDFRNNWLENPLHLSAAVRRLVRRVYQVVFVSLHRVLGLSYELTSQDARHPLDEAFVADQSTVVSPELRKNVVSAAKAYFEMEGDEYDEYFDKSLVVIIPRDTRPVRAGTRSTKVVYVYEGELEVSQMMEFQDDEVTTTEEKAEAVDMEEILYYVPAGEAIGGLSFLTDGVNIFNIRIPDKAVLFIMPEEVILKLLHDYPLTVLKLAHSVVLRMSAFMRQMDFGLEWSYYDSGQVLFNVGDEPDNAYLVLSGRLRSIIQDENGRTQVLGEYGRHEWIGLVETLTKKRRSKTVIAVRDTELAKIPHGVLHLIKLKFPVVTIRLLNFIGNRVSKSYKSTVTATVKNELSEGSNKGPRGCATVALLPVSEQTPVLCIAYELYLAFLRYGTATIVTHQMLMNELGPDVLLKSNDYLLTSWLANKEEGHELVIYVAEANANRWTIKCIRQADAILVLANTLTDTPELSAIEVLANKEAARTKKELILLHRIAASETEGKPGNVYPLDSKSWLEIRPWLAFHHHVGLRSKSYNFLDADLSTIEKTYLTEEEKIIDVYSDYSRVSRWISGNSVGVVLGGGGAKGAAHIGMLRAIREQNIPIDMISGVSIGSFVGGLYATHQDMDTVERIARVWFSNIANWWRFILDFTIPFVAILNGEGFNFCVRECHGEVQIEDCWIPYFCLSTNITANCPRVHRSGQLWRYSRASMTLVGMHPPLCDPIDGHYLMDGGYTNLVPANVMRKIGAKYIIAVDVSAESEKVVTNYGDNLSGFKILLHKLVPFLTPLMVPSYFDINTQLAFVQSAQYLEIIKKMDSQSIYVRPPINCFTSADFPLFRDVLLTGYDFGKKLLRHTDGNDPLSLTWQNISIHLPEVESKPLRQKLLGKKLINAAGISPKSTEETEEAALHGVRSELN